MNVKGEEPEPLPGRSEQAGQGSRSKGKPPFQLCFNTAQELGRSYLSRPKLPQNTSVVTPKFYSRVDALEPYPDETVKALMLEIETLWNEGPREKNKEPVLESHNYGWYPEPLLPLVKTERRYNHHRMTSEMVKVQCILNKNKKAEKELEKLLTRAIKQD